VAEFDAAAEADAAQEIRAHIAERYGFGAQAVLSLDQDVWLLRRDSGPSWVARVFPAGRRAAAEGDAEILDWLAAQDYPAERCATADPVSERQDGRVVLVTQAVPFIPRSQRRSAVKDAGGIRGLGALMGRLHTLPQGPGACTRPGGAWHHMALGAPADELEAAREMLDEARSRASARDLASFDVLEDALDLADDCDGLPEALIHPDFVLANVVATAEPSMVLVDWSGAGRGPRLWSLAFLLLAEGAKDLRRVELALAGYRRHVQLEPEELERLEAAIPARPLVLTIWGLRHHGIAAATAAQDVLDTRRLASKIAALASSPGR
jgi:Ser/Thr protein kinase RdoA (MazF antagonist)